ncbi:uroporphyrinogen-III synthase [Acinetobacter apis]|uniref:Uroporphyrinogen-III synthase n=1 Tax=Acinetobacter apis TaxID=1229165 RepID=A0A217EHS8_9GAMM|nr:uroporphyrinogen-III synthase [Acinetobacter apis]SNQ30059.1 uroporphyrinogen-III synthase [Acinetobacter apis]
MLFINTRPSDRAQQLTTKLKETGIQVLDLPLLELSTLPLDEALIKLFLSLPSAEVIVVVSPTAADIGLAYLKACHISLSLLSHIHWIAVGEKTAAVLKKAGLNPYVPEVETSEGMLDIPVLQQHATHHVAFWRGIGGRQFMMQHLASKGLQISNFLLYQRALPVSTQQKLLQNYAEIQMYQPNIYVCISSEASWLNWKSICHHHLSFIQDCYYVALGARLTTLLMAEVDPTHVYEIENLHATTISQVMVKGQKRV